MKIYEGHLSGEGKNFGIIVSRFNSFVTDRLLEGAIDCLTRHNTDPDAIEVFKVPGAFEIPQTLSILVRNNRFDAIICLAAIIRGETPHFDFLARDVSRGIANISIESGIPVGFGIITADTNEQAIDRAGGKRGNKGFYAALSVIEQLGLIQKIHEKSKKGKRTRP
ncbi:MAG: 6,7-dimethyl-8-ribityllumazine synthase [bacterium]|nr:6,7-dimethyl-8-ribityllumazine synthase [bacterium]